MADVGGLENRPRPRPQVRRLIQEEVQGLAGTAPLAATGAAPSGSRSKVRRLIMEEIESLLAAEQPRARPAAAVAASLPRATGSPAPPATIRRTASTPVLRPPSGAIEMKPKDAKEMLLSKEMTLEPSARCRKTMSHRTPYGGFVCDAPAWQVDSGSRPVLPSRADELSGRLWASYIHDQPVPPMGISESQSRFVDHMQQGPQVKLFMNPLDDFIRYRNEVFKPANQLTMRKNSGPGGFR